MHWLRCNFFRCFIHAWGGYSLLGTVVWLLEIKFLPQKICSRAVSDVFFSLIDGNELHWFWYEFVNWNFRTSFKIKCFSQGRKCTNYGDFFHCSKHAWDGYTLLWTAVPLTEYKWQLLKNLLYSSRLLDVVFLLSTGKWKHWKPVHCYVYV